jgi:hypothetical protein
MAERPARQTRKRVRLVEEDGPSASSSSSRAGRPSFLQRFDEEIARLYNNHYKPAKIAELLCSQYSLDPQVVTRTGVESRLRIIKKNSLYPLIPTNSSVDLRAFSALPSTCIPFLFIVFIENILGQGHSRAAALAEGLTIPEEPAEVEEGSSEEEPSKDREQEILAFLQSIGLIYTHSGEKRWSVFVSRSLTASIEVNDPEENGILVSWEAIGPDDSELASARPFTEAVVREFDYKPTVSRIFIPSDKPLCLDTSQMKRTLIPPQTPRWMLITVPYKVLTPHVFQKMDPLPVEKMVQES